jgi:hypothetical protein
LDLAKSIPVVRKCIDQVYAFRMDSKAKTTNGYANIPHKFAQRSPRSGNAIIVPSVSSERRDYVPIGFLGDDTIISNLAFAINNAEPWVFSVISSRMHNVWIRAVGGRLEERIRYSVGICYNTFPLPELTDRQKESLAAHAFNVLSERECHPEKTIAQLYDPGKMPSSLAQAHRDLDAALERCYRSRPFNDDAQRLESLFQLYEEMTANA